MEPKRKKPDDDTQFKTPSFSSQEQSNRSVEFPISGSESKKPRISPFESNQQEMANLVGGSSSDHQSQPAAISDGNNVLNKPVEEPALISSSELNIPQVGETGLAANSSVGSWPIINVDEVTEDQIFEFERLMEAFQAIDKDKTGFVSSTDLRDFVTNFGDKFTEEEADEMIRDADVNGDGLINYEVFIKLMMA